MRNKREENCNVDLHIEDITVMKKYLEKKLSEVYLHYKYDEIEYTLKVYKMIHILLRGLINNGESETIYNIALDFYVNDLWEEYKDKEYEFILEDTRDIKLAGVINKVVSSYNKENNSTLLILEAIDMLDEIYNEIED